ncbi:MAG: hypothetical protein GVY23_04025 [Spirochaetes bacterium]|jgi:mannobiose 2-epimerase|nr:hypothetical protein [Spirochaetota bacterium]
MLVGKYLISGNLPAHSKLIELLASTASVPHRKEGRDDMTLPAPMRKKLFRIQEQAREQLASHVMPFWVNNAWDSEYGGFLTRLDRRGRRLDSTEKFLMMQVRMLASLSWTYEFGIRDGKYLRLAEKTFEFLINSMWDSNKHGFFFTVDRDGRPRSRRKNTDAHAYTLTGLSAYYAVSGDNRAAEYAAWVYDLFEAKARDGSLGYLEDFDGQKSYPLNAEQMNLAPGAWVKTVDMHTNAMEAFSYLMEATSGGIGVHALTEVRNLIMSRGIDPDHGCSITAFTREWVPIPDAAGHMTTSFGLNVELAWLLLKADALLGPLSIEVANAAKRLVDHALEYGFDWNRGGLAAHGPYDEPAETAKERGAASTIRPWWTQAELMNALVDLSHMTEEPRYVEALTKQWDWIWEHQIDHEYGSWYQEIDPATNGPVTSDKGGEWKTSFHVSRALIRIVEGIERLAHGKDKTAGPKKIPDTPYQLFEDS